MHGVCMQDGERRTQKDRSDAMRAALVRAGRALFVEQGFAGTGTPDIVALAGVTRGALYHHFEDKQDLFAAVVMAEAQAIAGFIEATEFAGLTPVETLVQGGRAFLSAMRVPGRVRLMLVEAPAVLDPRTLAEIDAATGGLTLREGLEAAGVAQAGPMAALLSAGYDRAALAIDGGEAAGPWDAALERLVRGVVG
jgi:AcrR family transcriptional regulator